MGWKPEEVKISNLNSIDTMIGHATLYKFDLQIGNAILPLRLSEDVTSWQFMEDVFANEDQQEIAGSENTVVERRQQITPVLAPFQLAGPLELWIQDADHMRLSLPHDVGSVSTSLVSFCAQSRGSIWQICDLVHGFVM
jgi:hypothetical protein